jgi:hypothetical protein
VFFRGVSSYKDSLPTKLPNGEAVREFYLSLSIIQEYYWEKGYRKKAYLYRTLKEKLGWKTWRK